MTNHKKKLRRLGISLAIPSLLFGSFTSATFTLADTLEEIPKTTNQHPTDNIESAELPSTTESESDKSLENNESKTNPTPPENAKDAEDTEYIESTENLEKITQANLIQITDQSFIPYSSTPITHVDIKWGGLEYSFETTTGALEITGGTINTSLPLYDLEGKFQKTLDDDEVYIQSITFTGPVVVGTDFFGYFQSLEYVRTIEGFGHINTNKAQNFGQLFANTPNLEELDLSNLDTSYATDMQDMFQYSGVQTIIFGGNFFTQDVDSMNNMFLGTSNLKELENWDEFNTESLENAGTMFFGSAIEYLDLSDFDLSALDPNLGGTGKAGMLGDLRSLHTLVLGENSNLDGTLFGIGFEHDLPYTQFNLYEGKAWLNADGTVYDTAKLINASKETGAVAGIWELQDYWNGITYTFDKTSGKLDITGGNLLKGGTTGYYFKKLEEDFINKDRDPESEPYTINKIEFKREILASKDSSKLFSDLSNLDEIINLNNLNTENVINMDMMFLGLSLLTQLDLSNFNTEKVTNMQQMFYGLSSLTSLDVSSFNTSNVENMEQMFLGLSLLTQLDLSNFNTEKVIQMSYMFSGNILLASLDISSFDTTKVTHKEGMLIETTSLHTLTLGDSTNISDTSLPGLLPNYLDRWVLQPEATPLTRSEQVKTSAELMTASATGAAGTWKRNARFEQHTSNFAVHEKITDADLKNAITSNLYVHDLSTEKNLDLDFSDLITKMRNVLGETDDTLETGIRNFNFTASSEDDNEYTFTFTLFVYDGDTSFTDGNDLYVSLEHFEHPHSERADLDPEALLEKGNFEVTRISDKSPASTDFLNFIDDDVTFIQSDSSVDPNTTHDIHFNITDRATVLSRVGDNQNSRIQVTLTAEDTGNAGEGNDNDNNNNANGNGDNNGNGNGNQNANGDENGNGEDNGNDDENGETNGNDENGDSLTTGAENISAPTGKSLPSTGESIGFIFSLGLTLATLAGFLAWLRHRK
ncbi:BspA family leucine-rich repeat surface protein [Lactococcus protaetiae]|uniref:BspA family leucine-rich repeat surface protein n=1 Tax=Lactococcus protaetiae TaxID=2592653 RepID=A0A514Z749_9LACT|nr:BspA family leucine-rich repeat surface protein [Lactococcus protaetiae]QDK70420.1 BspA family leucine-rich repeat surface protein [Lactococcus protaetiae]